MTSHAIEADALAVIGTSTLLGTSEIGGKTLSVPIPFANPITLIEETRVAGTSHVPDIDGIVARLERGFELRLQREPDNLVDSWAIQVYAEEDRIGYVSADCNEILARLMDGGKALSATLLSKELIGTWHKITMAVRLDD